MVSAEGTDKIPHLPMAENDKKTIKSILKKPFQALFQKDKKKEKKQVVVTEHKPEVLKPPPKVTPVSVLLENFQNLEINKRKNDEEEDEMKNFSFHVVEEEKDRTPVRTDSHSSEDSGFSDKCSNEVVDSEDEKEKQLIESMKDLKVEAKADKNKKKKKVQTVFVSRGPIRNKVGDYGSSAHPYTGKQETAESVYRQINQVNKQTFSGGHVLTKCTPTDYLSEINYVLNKVDQNVQNFAQNSEQEQENDWQVALEFLEKTHTTHILHDFPQDQITQDFTVTNNILPQIPEPNPVEEFSNANHAAYEEFTDLEFASISDYVDEDVGNRNIDKTSIFPTPPRSENVTSPMSDSNYNQSHSEYTLSPDVTSPLYNSDNEKYQDLTQFEISHRDYPRSVTDNIESDAFDRSKKERCSTSSMTMKQYKDLQKDISASFSKKECCQASRKTCKLIFVEHMEKLKVEDRRYLCVKVANMDLKTAYGLLHHILLSLSSNDKEEDLQLALFYLICERVMAQKPGLFVGDFGLSLIKSAALRCCRRPILTRYLVQCVRNALRQNHLPQGTEHVFHEVDALGDNLLIACVRAGDACADALSELVRRENGETPLFDMHHANTDGHTALHVACSMHSAELPKVHTLHVLLQHGGADVWRGDMKGGDTALHLAINSPTCDVRVVMVIFRHVDRKLWKRLAHAHNRSSVTPLEYARSAIKSTTRQNYPHEVLEFLKKCR